MQAKKKNLVFVVEDRSTNVFYQQPIRSKLLDAHETLNLIIYLDGKNGKKIYLLSSPNIFITLKIDLFGCFRIEENKAMAMKPV